MQERLVACVVVHAPASAETRRAKSTWANHAMFQARLELFPGSLEEALPGCRRRLGKKCHHDTIHDSLLVQHGRHQQSRRPATELDPCPACCHSCLSAQRRISVPSSRGPDPRGWYTACPDADRPSLSPGTWKVSGSLVRTLRARPERSPAQILRSGQRWNVQAVYMQLYAPAVGPTFLLPCARYGLKLTGRTLAHL